MFSKTNIHGFTPGVETFLGIEKTDDKRLVRLSLIRPQKGFKRWYMPFPPVIVETQIDLSVHNNAGFQENLETPLYLLSN